MLVAAACTLLVSLVGLYVLTPLFREPKGNLDVELLAETEIVPAAQLDSLRGETGELVAIFVASLKTARGED